MKLSWPRRGLACAAAVTMLATGFSVVSTAESAQAAVPDVFGFVLWNGSTTVSSGTFPASTTVTPGGAIGQYKIVFPGKAGKGVAHVTAINPEPHWCQIASFGPAGADEVVLVNCYKVGGALDNTAFSAIYFSSSGAMAGAGLYGYVSSQPNGTLVTQYNSAGATNTVTPTAVGQWTVKFPGLNPPAAGVYGSLQATAVNPQVPARCKVSSWTSGPGQTVQVACYNAAGAALNTQFNLTYQYQRSLYGGAFPPKNFAYLWTGGAAGASPTSYNSNGGANAYTLGPITPVTFPLMGVTPDNVQVTATGSNSDFCGLDSIWGGATVAKVNCFTNAGAAATDASLVSYNSAV